MKYMIIAIVILAVMGCSNHNSDLPATTELKGKWIEVGTRTDTLSFEIWEGKQIMNLNRGRELRDGNPYTLPKYGSGPYDYTLLNDKISLRWMLSSNSNYNDYEFEVSGNTLFIGNFYDSPSGDLLTFERLD